MQIVKYEINKNILTVGFKENDSKGNNFIVYTQLANDTTKTRHELLQKAYIQCKHSINYEKTLLEHSLTIEPKVNEKTGAIIAGIYEEFVPEEPRAIKLEIDFNTITGRVLDQYGDVFSTDVKFSIEGNSAKIENNKVVESIVTKDAEYYIIAKYLDFIEKQKRIICIPSQEQPRINENTLMAFEAISGLDERINKLEKVVVK